MDEQLIITNALIYSKLNDTNKIKYIKLDKDAELQFMALITDEICHLDMHNMCSPVIFDNNGNIINVVSDQELLFGANLEITEREIFILNDLAEEFFNKREIAKHKKKLEKKKLEKKRRKQRKNNPIVTEVS
jgi:hypothetical protein